jgi:hypothetical protein
MLRVVCMALMNVIPVVATIFGAAYAVQPAYGVLPRTCSCGFRWSSTSWRCSSSPFVGNLSDEIGRKPPIIIGALAPGLLSFAYLYAISTHNVPLAIAISLLMWGVVYQSYNAIFPSFCPSYFRPARASRRWRSRRMSEPPSRRSFRLCSQPWRRPARPTFRSYRFDRLHHNDHLGGRRHECARDLSDPHERPRSTRRGSGREAGVRPDAGANPCRCRGGQSLRARRLKAARAG